jgi:hypothetical protein
MDQLLNTIHSSWKLLQNMVLHYGGKKDPYWWDRSFKNLIDFNI